MISPKEYLDINDLWDLESLKLHAQERFVYVITSEKFPDVVMLKYMDECQYDNKWSDFSRLCRGLILDLKSKVVLAHAYNKFFNLDQVPEVSYDILKSSGTFEASEKLDGSCCILYVVPSTKEYRFTTTGSLESKHGEYATSIMPLVLKDSALIDKYTLVFELISRQFQIVVNYAKKGYQEGLYLIGAREKATDRLLSYAEVAFLAAELRLPCVKTYVFESLDALIETSKNLSILDEGFVLRWEPELLVKIKGPKYIEMHRFISHLSDKNILQAVADDTDRILMEVAPEEYRTDIINKIKYFNSRVDEIVQEYNSFFFKAPKETRKEFALWVNGNVPNHLKGFMFKAFDKVTVDKKWICYVIQDVDNVSGKTQI